MGKSHIFPTDKSKSWSSDCLSLQLLLGHQNRPISSPVKPHDLVLFCLIHIFLIIHIVPSLVTSRKSLFHPKQNLLHLLNYDLLYDNNNQVERPSVLLLCVYICIWGSQVKLSPASNKISIFGCRRV